MAKIPHEVISFIEGPGNRIVLGFIDADGAPSVLSKGKLIIVDDETVAFADRANIKLLTDFKPNDKAAIIAAGDKDRFGYQITGTFQEYQTSGVLFDEWAAEMGGPAGELLRMGLIKVDKICSFINGAHGKQIV